MYMAGRLRTASSPSNTNKFLAPYSRLVDAVRTVSPLPRGVSELLADEVEMLSMVTVAAYRQPTTRNPGTVFAPSHPSFDTYGNIPTIA